MSATQHEHGNWIKSHVNKNKKKDILSDDKNKIYKQILGLTHTMTYKMKQTTTKTNNLYANFATDKKYI